MFDRKISIVGAGLGGLVLARILQTHGIEAEVYESDVSTHARDQGSMLDMHVESGQHALSVAGLTDEFRRRVLIGGDAMRVLDKAGLVRYRDDGDGKRPEIERGDLRTMLLESTPNDRIHWGTKIVDVSPLGDGRHKITTATRDSFTTDLLVGADGAWSKVRSIVSDAKPVYLGVSFVESRLKDAHRKHPGAAQLVGPGSMFALSDEKGLIAHRGTNGDVRIYIALKEDEQWTSSGAIDFTDAASAKAALLGYFADWNEALRALILHCETDFVPRQIHALPVGHRWSRIPGVTLVGDAAHLMSPFAGEGANQAMLDGAELGQALVANQDDIERALATYEETMFSRSAANAAESASNLSVAFRPDAPQGLLDLMTGHRQ